MKESKLHLETDSQVKKKQDAYTAGASTNHQNNKSTTH
jgi:hypothetical protein